MLLLWLSACNPVPHITDLSVEALPCGQWEVWVQGGGLATEARLRVDGQERPPQALGQDGDATFRGRGAPGETLRFEVSVGGVWRSRALLMPELREAPLGLSLGERPLRLAGTPLALPVQGRPTECARRDYRWEASLTPGGFDQPLGPLPEEYEEVLLTTPPLEPGSYDLKLRVLAPWGLAQEETRVVEVVASYDADGDGLEDARVPGGADCDDADPDVPSANESPEINQRDEDCDGRVDEGTRAFDDDRDSYSEAQGDCDDADPSVSPLAKEVSDCRDQDCDGEVDEGVESGCP